MARQLKWWIGAVLLACGALAVAYLPPRATPLFGRRYRVLEPPTPYRLRVEALAAAWREADLQIRLLDYRDRLGPELRRRRQLEIPGAAVLIDWPEPLPDSVRASIGSVLDTAWARLGLGATKISVAVILASRADDKVPGRPPQPQVATAYLLPDTSDRSTCLVYLKGDYWARQLRTTSPRGDAQFEKLLQSGMGPCAFYARFGSPGRDIARWLSARRFDLALYPRWQQVDDSTDRSMLVPDRHASWFWWQVYQYPPEAIACLAGRRDACRSAVMASVGSQSPPTRLLTIERWWRRQALAGGDRYLADVVRRVGSERFQHFWNSDLPADTALAAALRKPVGDWTRDWQAGLVPPIDLGPAIPPGSVLLGLALAAAALGLALRTAARREVG